MTHKQAPLTAAYVEGVVFVQGPAAQVGRHQLKAVHGSRPPLPLDGARARLVLITHRNCTTGVRRWRRKGRKRKQNMSAMHGTCTNNSNCVRLDPQLRVGSTEVDTGAPSTSVKTEEKDEFLGERLARNGKRCNQEQLVFMCKVSN